MRAIIDENWNKSYAKNCAQMCAERFAIITGMRSLADRTRDLLGVVGPHAVVLFFYFVHSDHMRSDMYFAACYKCF